MKWKRGIGKIRILSLKRLQKVIPKIPRILEIGNPIPEKEETNRLI